MSESGASVYSASDVAAQELPELDISVRGAGQFGGGGGPGVEGTSGRG